MKNSNTLKILLSLCLFFSVRAFSQYKVIGYLPVYGIYSPDLAKIPFEKITHLNLAFINPDSLGNFVIPARADTIIKIAHAVHVKVLASIGGGNAPVYFERLLTNANRESLVNHILQFADQYQLDGIDIDLEGKAIDEHYEIFLAELSKALKKQKKLLTAAIATGYSAQISNAAIAHLDFVNIMAYDKTGPWTPDRPGHHAPYELAVEDLNSCNITRGVSPKKTKPCLPL